MMRAALFILLLGAGASHAWASEGAAPPFDLKGVHIGDSEADLKRAFPAATCSPPSRPVPVIDLTCSDSKNTLADVPARYFFALFEGRVTYASASFNGANFAEVSRAAETKYGQPDRTETKMLKLKGEEFPNTTRTWERGDERVYLERIYLGRLGESQLVLSRIKPTASADEKLKQDGARRAKDM